MFNEQDKQRFIDNINLDQYPDNYWNALFNKTQSIEEMYGKDLYNFSKIEITSLYKYLDSKSFDYIRVINFNLIKYAQWAMSEALIVDGQNHYAELTTNEISECINKFGFNESILTKDTVYSLLPQISSARDRFSIIATYEGLKGINYCEIIRSNIADISGNKMKLVTGRTVDVSDKLVALATEASEERIYISPAGKNFETYGDYGSIYRTLREDFNEEYASKRFQKVFRNILDTLGMSRYITLNSLFTSGLIDKINQFADQDNITAEEVLRNEKYLEYLKNQYGYNRKITKTFLLKYKDFLR